MPLLPTPPLFAWLQELGPLLVVVFWVVRQVLLAGKDKQEDEAARPPRERPGRGGVDAGPVAAPAGAAKGQERLRGEVDDFLRRVEQMRGDEPADADEPPKRRPSLDPFEEPVRRRRTRRAVEPTPSESIELLVDPSGSADGGPKASVADQPAPSPKVADRSMGHLRESQLAENAAHLGERISGASERVEARLHEKFDHRLGTLGKRSDDPSEGEDLPAEPAASAAARIRRMLSEPSGARDAFVLSEVFGRRGL